MDRFTTSTTDFIGSLRTRPTRRAIDDLLRTATDEEEVLRTMFVRDRRNPLLQNQFIGLIDAFSVPLEVRRIRARPRDGANISYFSNDRSYESYDFPPDHLFPLKPDLVRRDGEPCMVRCIKEFRSNFEIFTQGALKHIRDWSNVVVAGGSVLACLFPPQARDLASAPSLNVNINKVYQSDAYNGSDIDLFLWGLTSDEAKTKILEIYHCIQTAVSWPVTCVRKSNTITIRTTYPIRPIQIVLRLYLSPAEILAGFDVDCACCLYNGKNVYMNPRALAACIRQANTINLSRRSPSYEIRLAKYANRGFEVYHPRLDRLRLDYDSLYAPTRTTYPTGLALLIVLEFLYKYPGAYRELYRARFQDTAATPLNFVPIERKLLTSNYDSSWLRVPYGPTWDAKRIDRLIARVDKNMNSRFNPSHGARRMHRHLAVSGSMATILTTPPCENCPTPSTPGEIALAAAEKLKYVTGYVSFISDNPGRQTVGSFNPLYDSDWASGAYTAPGSPLQRIYITQSVDREDENAAEPTESSESLSEDNDFRSAESVEEDHEGEHELE